MRFIVKYTTTPTYLFHLMLCVGDNIRHFLLLVNSTYKQQNIHIRHPRTSHAHFYPHIGGIREVELVMVASDCDQLLLVITAGGVMVEVEATFPGNAVPVLDTHMYMGKLHCYWPCDFKNSHIVKTSRK